MRQEGLGAERLAGGPREAERRGRGPVQGRVVGVAVRPGVALPLRLVALPVAVVRVVLRVPATAENERDTIRNQPKENKTNCVVRKCSMASPTKYVTT